MAGRFALDLLLALYIAGATACEYEFNNLEKLEIKFIKVPSFVLCLFPARRFFEFVYTDFF